MAYRQFGFSREGSKCDLSRSYKAVPSLLPTRQKNQILAEKAEENQGKVKAGVST